MEITTSITINAPKDRVFALFTDFENLERNVQGIQKITFLEGEGRAAVGMKWQETRTMFGKEATEIMWITEMAQPEQFVVEAESHGVHYRSTYTFEEVGGATVVSLTFNGTPLTLMTKIMGPIMAIFFKGATIKAFQADMKDLKEILERS